ncbi:ADP-ribosylation factor-like protein 13B [Anguilla anguilla]|uniref:ADP-ribosylation factor-like protein 13B n=1 Tax=Anguilla anguilla TaxID=7936 RepID=UPI0015B2A80E|nr:ADP-ribosylation factor-like protein 13B [Anguilla anguilla]XP_035248020.1 ADP-ribosylation factor-like protein 13B [Anguilla anguilla]
MKVTLTMLGLDNAGKTATVRVIKGENPEDVFPNVGFSAVGLKKGQVDLSIFDLGGTESFRDIWRHYFPESHGVIFVVDSSDVQRMQETRKVLAKVLGHPRVAGKPVLLLANKQDVNGALCEDDIIDRLSLEETVTLNKCYCQIVPCSAVKKVGKKAIKSGLDWLLKTVARDYDVISERVQKDTEEQREKEAVEMRERVERVRLIREERENREREEAEQEGRTTETEDEGNMANLFKPTGDINSEMGDKQKTNSELQITKTDADSCPEKKWKFWQWKKNRVGPLSSVSAKTPRRLMSGFKLFRRNAVAPL